ncbi:MAG: hypothetical protein ACJ8M1_11200 [Chthoniobacterales bacterium]
MTIPFLDLFKKAKARLGKHTPETRVAVPRGPLAEKPAGERLSKTVMPNTTRTVAPADPFQVAAGSAKGRTRETPTPLTPSPEPSERAIKLVIADFLDQLPTGSVKPSEAFDATRTITIKAAEVEKGMAIGKPAASLISIYEQAPELFIHPVTPDDLTQVSLPLQKVLQQFETLQVREDQMEDQAVPQVDTPFLQVTIEDTQKFGTSLAPLQTSAAPPVKVEPATARSLAKAEPEPVAQRKQAFGGSGRRRISLTPPNGPTSPPAVDAAGSSNATPSPTRIPFKLPPNGAGAPASERVPASSGPPVPTPSSAPPKTNSAPVRIPFKLTPPNDALKPKLTLVPGVDPGTDEAEESSIEPVTRKPDSARASTINVRLRLNVCFRNLPAFQLKGELPEIADDVVVELPFSIIEPQLASGRVAIEPKLFHDAIPEAYRDLFVTDATETPVLLPLQEVLQHLPTAALKMRDDQEHEEVGDYFETPFSFHAKEDQKRFDKGPSNSPADTALEKPSAAGVETPKIEDASSIEKNAEAKAPAPAAEPDQSTPAKSEEKIESEQGQAKAELKPEATATAEPSVTAEQPGSTPPATAEEKQPAASDASSPAPSPEAKSSAKEFVLRASCLPGVTACSISFADGLTMAGNLPPGTGTEGLCAVAPSLLQKIEKHMLETNLGEFTSMTLHCSKTPMSFFMEGDICLSVLHADRQLEPVTQEQLAEMTKELAQIFAKPEGNHVDH